MPDLRASDEDLAAFYEESYGHDGEQALRYERWRRLGAVGKAEHAIELCARIGLDPQSTLDVGCGDGALLSALSARGFGGRLHGVEIAQAAVDIASARGEIDSVALYDGRSLPYAADQYELGILSHVLEHVPEPERLLAEVARVCRAVVVEVPLEQNLSARRAGKRAHAAEVGHLQRLSRDSMRAIVAAAGLRLKSELEDPLPRSVHTFFADGAAARQRASMKWLARASTHRLTPALARRLFTVHYACICTPRPFR